MALKLAVIGGGWAGLACAVQATRAGHAVTLIEAARTLGGRARRVNGEEGLMLDNGQHILIGAYRATLGLMHELGVDLNHALLRLPLTLRFADGGGLAVPARLPPPLDLLAAMASARGWSWRDKFSLLHGALRWRLRRFECPAALSVAELCAPLSPRAMRELIAPLCVSALNVPPERASGQIFLRVLRDALFGAPGGADLLLPRTDLGALLPDPAARWLAQQGAQVRLGQRVHGLAHRAANAGPLWQVDGEPFDRVVLATPPWESERLVREALPQQAAAWLDCIQALRHESIATVYVRAAATEAAMPHPPVFAGAPLLALREQPGAPAQFVFDRARLGGPPGLAAFVVSASQGTRDELQAQVLAQARAELGWPDVQAVQTIVEKRATFACTPGVQRPPARIASGLLACGDYVAGPYPATLEGAVLSGLAAGVGL